MIAHVHIWQRKNGCTAKDKKYILDLLAYCKKVKPYVGFYKWQIKSYNDTETHILKNEIDLFCHNYLQNKSEVLSLY